VGLPALAGATIAAPLRIAHRGYAAGAPENTLEAFEAAIERGADVLEVDVRRRGDGALVAHHDRGDAPGAPLIADVLALAGPTRVDFNLDLKASGIESTLIGLVRDAGLMGRVTCTGGNWAMLGAIHKAEPGIRAGLTMPRRGSPSGTHHLQYQRFWYAWRAPDLLAEYDAQIVSCSRKLVSSLLVHRVHRAGAEIWVWTVDRPKEIERLLRLEVDGICSDDPASQRWA
jgi:glycerophosphoryl diester phosphodiesterase